MKKVEYIISKNGIVHKSLVKDHYFNSMNKIKDPTIYKLIEQIWHRLALGDKKISDIPRYKRNLLFDFINHISNKNLNELTWNYFCDLVKINKVFGYFSSRILFYLLDNGLYKAEFNDELLEIKDIFDVGKNYKNELFEKVFIYDEIKYLMYNPNSLQKRIFKIKVDEKIIWNLLAEFCKKDSPKSNPSLFYEEFQYSLDKYKVSNIEDFNYNTFITQTNFFSKKTRPKYLLLLLNRFYIFLIEHPSNRGKYIFKKNDNITLDILKRDNFASQTLAGFKVLYYNPFKSVPKPDKWILHNNGFEKNSTKMSTKFVRSYNFSKIKSNFYRKLTKKYIWEISNHNLVYLYDQLILLTISLNYLYELKSKNKYPNSDLKKINIHEANIIKNHIKKMDLAIETKNSYINAIKRFFEFQKDNNCMEFEILVFDYLSLISYRKRNKAKAIPDNDLMKINAVMKEKIQISHFNLLCYAIFHIALQTEFRISQICYLKTNCIQNTLKNKQFEIKTSSKTSNNQKYKAIISDLTKKHIDHVIIKSKKIREMCSDKKVKDYLFLYKSQQNRYKSVNSKTFRKYFANCCQEASVSKYTSNNIRDTHMTKAAEFNMRNNKNHASLTILSGHKRIDTATNHYLELQLTKMLESTYGIIIGDVDCNGKIVDSVNNKIAKKKHIVEQGCGYCQNDKCYITSTISCLMCKDFRTTVAHEKQFKINIYNLDGKIKNATNEHDKEDLINIKRLYSAYLLEIWKKKEGIIND